MSCRFRAGSGEAGFTLVELIFAVTLFSFIAYASISLLTGTFDTLARLLAEFESRKNVLMLHRLMAEGAQDYAGYLGATKVEFGPGDEGKSCVFGISFRGTSGEGKVEYVWWSDREVIEQYVDVDNINRQAILLRNVASFSVRKVGEDNRTIRVAIGHRVKGFAEPIVRESEGQVRNLKDLSELILEECVPS